MSEANATPLPMPRAGGCYVRLPDGSLVPENEVPTLTGEVTPAPDATPATPAEAPKE